MIGQEIVTFNVIFTFFKLGDSVFDQSIFLNAINATAIKFDILLGNSIIATSTRYRSNGMSRFGSSFFSILDK